MGGSTETPKMSYIIYERVSCDLMVSFDVFLSPGDWGHLGFLHLHLHSLFLLEDPP